MQVVPIVLMITLLARAVINLVRGKLIDRDLETFFNLQGRGSTPPSLDGSKQLDTFKTKFGASFIQFLTIGKPLM